MPFPALEDMLDAGTYMSRLPEPAGIGGLPVGPTGVPELWAQRTVESTTILAGHFMQGVATSIGWTENLDTLKGLIGTAQRIQRLAAEGDPDPLQILGAIRDMLAQHKSLLRAALGPALRVVQDAISGALAGAAGIALSGAQVVPIIGWAIAIIRSVVSAARTVRENQERGYGILPGTIEGLQEGVVPTFSRGRDAEAANGMLAVLRTRDWTDLWMPSLAGWNKLALDFDGNRKIDGWYFGPEVVVPLATGVPMPGGYWSAMPGLAQIGAAFYGDTHFGANLATVRSISDCYPSANQLAGMAWTHMQMPTGSLCNVDLRAVEYAWGIWQGNGRKWLETGGMRLTSNSRPLRMMVMGALGLQYTDAHEVLRTNLYPGSRGRLGSFKPVAKRVREACADMRKTIHQMLATTACAYVPPDAPALRDVELKVRYAAMRVALLKSEDRWDVDLDLVPDQPMRQALEESRRAHRKPVQRLRRRRTLDGQPIPPPRIPGVGGDGDGAGDGHGMGDGASSLVLAGGMAAALWALLRRK